MNWRHSVLACLLLAGCTSEEASDLPSPQQQRVDRSFSNIPIGTPFAVARPGLTEIRFDDCESLNECDWRDRDGVRYYFWGDAEELEVFVKSILAVDFDGRPIPALGLGLARGRDPVLAAATQFAPDASFECMELEDSHPGPAQACEAFLDPGWVTIAFDKDGVLTEVRLYGSHFT